MLVRLALLFVVIPLIELALLLQVGSWIGFWPTIGLVVGTGFLGAGLARAEGLRTWLAFQRELARGGLPGRALLDGISILVGGAFLLTPGLLTDIAGFSLLFPPTRRFLQGRARRWLERRVESGEVRAWTVGMSGTGGERTHEPVPELDPRHEIRQGESQGEPQRES